MIDHTLLRPEATADDIAALCAEATELGVAAVCVSPSRLPLPDDVGLGPGIVGRAAVGALLTRALVLAALALPRAVLRLPRPPLAAVLDRFLERRAIAVHVAHARARRRHLARPVEH